MDTAKAESYWIPLRSGQTPTYDFILYQSNLALALEKENHWYKPHCKLAGVLLAHYFSTAVEKVGVVHANLSGINVEDFEYAYKSIFSFTKIYKVAFQIEAVMGDDLGILHFRVVCKGKVVGTAELTFKTEI